jgi:hypothetical protein
MANRLYYVYITKVERNPKAQETKTKRDPVVMVTAREGEWERKKYVPRDLESQAHEPKRIRARSYAGKVRAVNSKVLRQTIAKRWPKAFKSKRWIAYFATYVTDRSTGSLGNMPPAPWVGESDWMRAAQKHYRKKEAKRRGRRD